MINLHPDIQREVNEDFRATAALAPVVAPPGGVDVADFIQEAKLHTSSWDMYVGMTPWVEMARLVDKRVIQPWDSVCRGGRGRRPPATREGGGDA